jgi:hypothetical protein
MKIDLVDERAKYAWKRVQNWTQPKQAVQIVKGLPVSIRTLGLAQGIAMLGKSSDGASQELSGDVCSWLLDASPYRMLGKGRADATGLIERIIESGCEEVRAAEEEAIRFTEVLKLFAELCHE